MKKIFYLLFLVSLASFAQGPNKNRDTATWENQRLKQGGVDRGGLLDASGSFVLPRNNVNRGIRNNLLGSYLDVSGTANDVRGNNHVVGNVIGADVSGADHTIYQGADYSSTLGDAHNSLGYACANLNFGNTTYGKFDVTLGNSNINGSLSKPLNPALANRFQSSFLSGSGMRSEGNYIFAHGRNLFLQGDNIIAFGYSSTPYLINTPNSFSLVYNGKLVFQITETGKVVLNGVQYTWPMTQGAPGSVLTNDGHGNLSWSASVQTAGLRQTIPLNRTYVATDMLGRQFFITAVK